MGTRRKGKDFHAEEDDPGLEYHDEVEPIAEVEPIDEVKTVRFRSLREAYEADRRQREQDGGDEL